jgi:methyltransferase
VLEIFAAPLMFGAWITAGVFSLLNAGVLLVRIRAEERALRGVERPC